MSQPLIDKTKSSSATALTALLPACLIRGAGQCLALRALQSLLVCLGLTCAAAVAAFAQQAQIVKSAKPIVCDEKDYQLSLVAAEATINGNNAKALGVVLTPDDAAGSKMFCLYWVDALAASPTHRDNTRGALGNALMNYGNGQTADGKPVIEAFFAEAKCLPTDSQVTGVQDLIKNVKAASKNLREVASDLKSHGVGVDDGKVEDISAENKALFAGLQNDMGFAKAIQQYVFNALVVAQNTDLKTKVKELIGGKGSIFGGAPRWLIFAFFAVLAVLLTDIGWAFYSSYKSKKVPLLKGGSGTAIEKPDLGMETPSGQLPQILGIWREIVSQSNGTLDRIEQRHSLLWRTDSVKPNLASQYRQCAKEWHDAYRALHTELQKFPAGPASSEAETGDTSQAWPSLSSLVNELTEVKDRVNGFDDKLAKYLEVSRSLQNIWQHWYGRNYSGEQGEQMDTLVEEVGEAISFYQSLRLQLGRQGLSVVKTKENWGIALGDLRYVREHCLNEWLGKDALLHEITEKIKTKMGDDAEVVKKYKTIDMSLHSYFGKNVDATKAVNGLIEERSRAMEKLGEYHPDLSFTGTIDAVIEDYRAVAGQVHKALPGAKGSMTEMVGSLVTEYQKLEPEAKRARQLQVQCNDLQGQLTTAHSQLEASKELVGEIALQLNYKVDRLMGNEQAITLTLNQLQKERESSVYQQLRMGLSAALIALGKATIATGSAEQAEVIEALYIDKVKKGLKELLDGMEEYSGDLLRLWSDGLATGVSQKWLHYLIRADLLLRTYYTGKQDFRLLREAVSLACSSLQAALYELKVEVTEIGLFEPLPQGIETEPVYPGLRSLPTVRDKVRRKLQNLGNDEVAVDVTSFPYRVSGGQKSPGRVSLLNPSAWLQN